MCQRRGVDVRLEDGLNGVDKLSTEGPSDASMEMEENALTFFRFVPSKHARTWIPFSIFVSGLTATDGFSVSLIAQRWRTLTLRSVFVDVTN